MLAVIGETAAGDETMDVGMQQQLLAPGVEHGAEADPCPPIAMGELEECFRDRIEEQVQGEGGGPSEEGVQGNGDGEDDVKVGNREQGLLLGLGPQRLLEAAAARTVPVTTGVVGQPSMATPVAFLEVPAELTGAACDEVMHDTGLMTAEAERACVVGENVSDSGLALVTPTTPVGTIHLLRRDLWPAFLSYPVEGTLGVVEVGLGEVSVDLCRAEATVTEEP